MGIFGEIFIDQKFMALFSLLFGAGILLFIERAESKDGRPILLNLWRNSLLLAMGILHALVWDGDVLTVYAVSSLFLIAFRKLPAKGPHRSRRPGSSCYPCPALFSRSTSPIRLTYRSPVCGRCPRAMGTSPSTMR